MSLSLTPDAGAALLARVRNAVSTHVVGQEDVINDVLLAFLARGHVLIEGVPGTAKTLLVRSLASALGLRFSRIQFTADLMPSDVTGVNVLRDPQRGFEFQPGPIFTDLLLGDEINRAPAKTQAALLEAMAERRVTVDGVTRPLGAGFTVFATQNPVEHEGTYPLPEAQLDRFLIKTVMSYPSRDAEIGILDRYADGFDAELLGDTPPEGALTSAEAMALRSLVDGVRVAPEVRAYVADITRTTRDEQTLALGASPRATVALFRTARAAALLSGRDFVVPDDVKQSALPVLRHRVLMAPELEVEGRAADDVLSAILERVPAPE